MHRTQFNPLLTALVAACLTSSPPAVAQSAPGPGQAVTTLAPESTSPLSLKALFERAWSRQPEARSNAARHEAANAARAAAASWTAEPAALELQGKSDRMGTNNGNREYEFGLAIPLWLPGERSRSGDLAEAGAKALASRFLAAQLRVSGLVREAWWGYRRADSELALAELRNASARTLAEDVGRRFKAGDLSRADLHLANGLHAQTEAALAEAQGNREVALNVLRGLVGDADLSPDGKAMAAEPLPATPPLTMPISHPAMVKLLDRAALAWRAAELANVRTRANPELLLATTRTRAQSGADTEQTYTLGLRFPFGAGPRDEARRATARAEALDAEAHADLEHSRIVAGIESARAHVRAAEGRFTAAGKRARYARESEHFFDKSFRLGETDLPTRLRIELEAAEAERQLIRARIDVAAAVSTLRQALGLLPE